MGTRRSALLYSVWKDENTPLSNILKPQLHYVDDSKTMHYFTPMRKKLSLVTQNTQLARQTKDKQFANYARMVVLQAADLVYLKHYIPKLRDQK